MLFAFVLLDLLFLVLCQGIGWEEVSEMTYFVSMGCKTLTQSINHCCTEKFNKVINYVVRSKKRLSSFYMLVAKFVEKKLQSESILFS